MCKLRGIIIISLAVIVFGYLILDSRTVKQTDSSPVGLHATTQEGSTVILDIQKKPAYFFSPG